MIDNGYVYVLMNPSMHNLVKIGSTVIEPEEIAKELSLEMGDITPFVVAYDCYFKNCTEVKSFVYDFLENKGFQVSIKNNFFEIPIKDAIDAILKAKEHFGEFQKNDFQNSGKFEENSEDKKDDYYPDYDNEEIRKLMKKAKEYQYGFGEEVEDINESINYYIKAINLGSIEANRELADIYYFGEKVKKDKAKAIKYYTEGAIRGDIDCYAELAPIYLEQNDENNAYECWEKYFTGRDVNEELIDWIGAQYLRFIAFYPREIEFTEQLKPNINEIIEKLSTTSLSIINYENQEVIHPNFIEYAKAVINGEVNQNNHHLSTY